MKIERELGSYGRWIIKEYISFRVGHGGATNAPDQIRDGKSGLVKSVTRVSAGLYTVTLRTDRPSAVRYLVQNASLVQPATTAPTQAVDNVCVVDNWSQTAGTFSVLAVTDSTAVDPDPDSRISLMLVCSISSVGTDAA